MDNDDTEYKWFTCRYCGYTKPVEEVYVCPVCGTESCCDCAGGCGCEVEEEEN